MVSAHMSHAEFIMISCFWCIGVHTDFFVVVYLNMIMLYI